MGLIPTAAFLRWLRPSFSYTQLQPRAVAAQLRLCGLFHGYCPLCCLCTHVIIVVHVLFVCLVCDQVVRAVLSMSFVVGASVVVYNLKSRFCKEQAWNVSCGSRLEGVGQQGVQSGT